MRGQGNRVRELREARRLSQRKLAELVGTSQQQIQRIEAGLQAARIDLALKIAKALGGSLADVFPGLKGALGRRGRHRLDPEALDDDEGPGQAIAEAGVHPGPNAWSVRCLLRGGGEVEAPIASSDRRRLRECLGQGRGKDGAFFAWDSKGIRLLLNPRHLLLAHLIFEPGQSTEDEPGKVGLDQPVSVFLADRAEPMCFEVEGDHRAASDGGELGELNSLWLEAEAGLGGDRFLTFTDVNGEEVWLRAADVALIVVPLWALHPELIPDPHTGETQT
jgi:transcriptional regulator with XRE-family HTH domain